MGIGTLLWISVSGEETVERGLRAPLELQQFPQGLEIQGKPRPPSMFAFVGRRARSAASVPATSSPCSTSAARARAIACFR